MSREVNTICSTPSHIASRGNSRRFPCTWRTSCPGPESPSWWRLQVFRVEAALLALFDDNRIFLRNAKGFQRGEFPWRWSFCAWCMATPQPEVLLVEDIDQDARCGPLKFIYEF